MSSFDSSWIINKILLRIIAVSNGVTNSFTMRLLGIMAFSLQVASSSSPRISVYDEYTFF